MFKDRVLFIDGEALIIDKPAGLPVDRPRDRSESLEDLLEQLTFGFQRPPMPVHRLDRDTSGCLLLARNPKALKRFQQAFEQGLVEKLYLAVVEGVPDAQEGVIEAPLAKISSREKGWRMVIDPKGKSAITHWSLIEAHEGRALIAFRPRTGRTHQIRVHAADALHCPIVGDPVYGDGKGVMLLHARAIKVPRGSKPAAEAEAPIPQSFTDAGFALEKADAAV
jgi:tRNA pseudouridine32 synthase/23S rRNA pseudouridine746 synthase